MSAEISNNLMYISDLTLNFLEDMGWYLTDK